MRRNQRTNQSIRSQKSLSKSSQMGQTSLVKNYTLAGLVQHIQLPLNQVIKLKQASKCRLDEKGESELQKLIKIQQQVANLKIIIHQYDAQIQKTQSPPLPKHGNNQKSAKTNHTLSPQPSKSSVFQLNSMKISDFERQVLKEKKIQISQNHPDKQNISKLMNITPQCYNSAKQNSQKVCQVISMRKHQKNTPFRQLELEQSPEHEQLQHPQAVEDDLLNNGFHVAGEEDQLAENQTKHLEQDKILKEIQSTLFQTTQNQGTLPQIPNITFFPAQQPPQNQQTAERPKSKKVRSQHFYFGHQQPVLPSRYPKRKFNYLELANLK